MNKTMKQRTRTTKIKSSPYRKQIDKFLTEGKTTKWIHNWLDEKGESISENSIYRYKNQVFNIQKKGVEEYYTDRESAEKLSEAATKYSNNVHLIDKFIKQAADKLNVNELSQGQLAQFLVQLLRERREMLKQDEAVIVNIENKIGEENLFQYSKDEIEMIKKWGNQTDKEFKDQL